jgi:hypothetical protein
MSIISRVWACAVTAALAVSLAGCTSPTPPSSTPSPAFSSDTSADPETTWSSEAAAEGQLFNGNCENLFDPDELATTYGEGTDPYGYILSGSDPLFGTVGGIDCDFFISWNTPEDPDENEDDGEAAAGIHVTVVPATITDASTVHAWLSPATCTYECVATGVSGAWWYTLSVRGFSSASLERSRFKAINKDLVDALSDVADTGEPTIERPFDCGAAQIDGISVTSSRAMTEDGVGTAIAAAAFLLGGPVTCSFALPDDMYSWDLTVYPNSAAAYVQCTGPEPDITEIDGVVAAAGVESESDSDEFCATDGKSLIRVHHSYDSDDELQSSEPAVAVLEKLLVPLFAVVPPPSMPWSASPTVTTSTRAAPLAHGDCAELLDTAMIAKSLKSTRDLYLGSDDLAIAAVGGLDCTYALGPMSETDAFVTLTVAPSAIVDPTEQQLSLVAKQCTTSGADAAFANSVCEAAGTVDGWWYQLSVSRFSSGTVTASFDTIFARLTKKLRTAEAPATVGSVAPFDCKSAETGATAVSGSRSIFDNWSPARLRAVELHAAALLRAAPTTCSYMLTSGTALQVTVYPGTASIYRQCDERSNWIYNPGPITLPGVKAAFGEKYSNGGPNFCATDGTSTVYVNQDNDTKPIDLGKKAKASEVGALLVAVFAAAD